MNGSRRVQGRWLITGASRGVGEAVAREVARRGGRVVLVARDGERLAALARELGGAYRAADLASPGVAASLLSSIEDEVGPVDVLVNNAALDVTGSAAAVDARGLADIVALNVGASLALSTSAIARMGARHGGWIVNVSSVGASAAFPGMAVYAATKAAVSQFSRVVRAEAAMVGVGVTLVSFGPVATDMLDQLYKYEPLRLAFTRALRSRVSATLPVARAATLLVDAVAAGKHEVVAPGRLWPFVALGALPQALTSAVLLRGIPPVGRHEPGRHEEPVKE